MPVQNTPSAANFTTYQTIVLERYRLRTTYLMLREALPRLERGENVSDELAASLLRIAQPSGKYEHGPEDIARAAVDAVEVVAAAACTVSGMSTDGSE